jgi:hypothetical protein
MQRLDLAGRGTAFIGVTLALLTGLGMSLRSLHELRGDGLSNPDSYMRLARLRDMLDSGSVVFSVDRDGSGHGTVLHWSHLIDSLLCVLALPFSLFLDPHAALHAAAVGFGPLNIAALAFAIVWAAAPFADHKWLWLGAVLAPLSPAIISYGVTGVVHHHIAIVIVAVATWGWAARLINGGAAPTAGVALGAWTGLGVWLTPETVPLTMMSFGALGLAWILYPNRDDIARAIALGGLSFALVTLLALWADPPASGIGVAEIDRLSILFSGLALAVASTGAGVWVAQTSIVSRPKRLAVACVTGIACCALWLAVFHHAIFHSSMALNETEWHAFFGHISEMMPVTGAFHAMHFLLTGAWALLIVVILAVRRRSVLLTYAAICLGVAMVIGAGHIRFSAYPEAAGAIALPVALTLASATSARWHQILQSFTRLAIILLFVQVPYLGQLPDLIASAHAIAAVPVPACDVADAIPMLTSHPGAVVLADVNDTPELLYKTQVRTVGSLYHRNIPGFLRLSAAWRAPPSQSVPREIDAAEVSLVLACRTPLRSPLVEDLETATLSDQVRTGHPPPWLVQIDENPSSGQVLYEVVRPGVGGQGPQATLADAR